MPPSIASSFGQVPTMPPSILYYNPRCSKCRQALDLLRSRGVEPQIVEYLAHPPTADELAALVAKLGFADARQLMRQGEPAYRDLGLAAPELTQSALIAALAATPELFERPVLVHGDRAVVGRPPERVLEIL